MFSKVARFFGNALFFIGVVAGVLVAVVILVLVFGAPDDREWHSRAKNWQLLKDAAQMRRN